MKSFINSFKKIIDNHSSVVEFDNEISEVITTSPNLSNQPAKSYYKWFQKALEFTTVYCTNPDQARFLGENVKIKDPWPQLKKLRIAIGRKCNWAEEKNHSTLLENVKWTQNLGNSQARGRSGHSDDPSIRKQMFYTAGHLHLEATVKYMNMAERKLHLSNDNESMSGSTMLAISIRCTYYTF